jgi:hypothetical protein
MKLVLLLFSFSIFAQSEQSLFCQSAPLALRLPEIAEKIKARSRSIIEEFHGEIVTNQKLKMAQRKQIEKFEFTDICDAQESVSELNDELKEVFSLKDYLTGVRVEGSNPSLDCTEVVKPDQQWSELRVVLHNKLCFGMKDVVTGIRCDSKKQDIKLTLTKKIQLEKNAKAQCLLILKQIRMVIKTLSSK